MIGTKIRKSIPQNHDAPIWLNGRVDSRFNDDSSDVYLWSVVYEDGDSEYMSEQQVYETFVGRRVEKRFGRQYFYGKVTSFSPADAEVPNHLWKVSYNDNDIEDYTLEELCELLVVGEENDPLPPPLSPPALDAALYASPATGPVGARRLPKALPVLIAPLSQESISTEVHITVDDEVASYGVGEDEVASYGTNKDGNSVNDDASLSEYIEDQVEVDDRLPPPSRQEYAAASPVTPEKASADHETSRDYDVDRAELMVSKAFRHIEEGLKTFHTSQLTKKRKGAPPMPSGRFVFRRSHGLAGPKTRPGITTLLGGDARQSWPVVTTAVTQFVKKDEFYVTHRGDWHPWGPLWAGDDGLLPIEAFEDTQFTGAAKNTMFHLFERCNSSPGHPRYHGPSASGFYFYAGVYRRVVGGDIMEESVAYKKPGFSHIRWAMAELTQQQRAATIRKNQPWEKSIFDSNDNNHVVTNVSEEHMQMASVNNEDDWEDWDMTKRETAAWVELFIEKDWMFRIVAVECVGYDEDLYQKLVEIGAINGQLPDDDESE
jgi:hypothetical protein